MTKHILAYSSIFLPIAFLNLLEFFYTDHWFFSTISETCTYTIIILLYVQALIWDITVKPKPIEDPILAFAAGGEVTFRH